VNKNFFQATYTTPRQISPEGYDVVLSKSLKDQLLIHLQARENCLNANQQWVVACLLKQMGYRVNVIDPADEEPKKKT